jgi:rhodanese-related sulfurtransferase
MNKKAFFSPSSLTILAQTIGSTIWYILIGFLASIILFLKKSKKILLISLIVILIISSFVIGFRFQETKKLNTRVIGDTGSEFEQWQEFMSESGFKVYENQSNHDLKTQFDNQKNVYLPTLNKTIKRVNLEKAIQNNNYKMFFIYPHERAYVVNSTSSEFGELAYFPHDKELFKKLIKTYNVSKDDKILLYCESGWSAKTIAVIFAYYGYSADYSSLTDIKNLDYIDSEFVNDYRKEIIVLPLKKGKGDKYIYFFMNQNCIGEPGLKKLGSSIVDNTKFIKIHQSFGKGELLEPGDLKNVKVICKDNIHCFLTRHYLLYINAQEIDKIYIVE